MLNDVVSEYTKFKLRNDRSILFAWGNVGENRLIRKTADRFCCANSKSLKQLKLNKAVLYLVKC